jgi:glycosyltransferase involved in cell wall biosynthesis
VLRVCIISQPYAQGKLVRCVVGEVFDAVSSKVKADGKWVGVFYLPKIKHYAQWSIMVSVVTYNCLLKNNVGLGQALNEGMKHCTYDYVMRMDTDDICQPTRFELQSVFMELNPDIDISGSCIREFIGDKNNIVSERKVPLTDKEIKKFARHKNPFNHMTVIFKKSSVQSVGGYQHHYLMEDYNLWLRLLGGIQSGQPGRIIGIGQSRS